MKYQYIVNEIVVFETDNYIKYFSYLFTVSGAVDQVLYKLLRDSEGFKYKV